MHDVSPRSRMSSWPFVIERPQTRQIGLLPRGEPITLMMLSSNGAIPT
jgi:hypothetical protein